MSTPVFPDPERVKTIRVMWTMEADIQVRNEQFTDAQGQPREPELLDEATLIELAWGQIDGFAPYGPLIHPCTNTGHQEGEHQDDRTDYELLNCEINGDITPC